MCIRTARRVSSLFQSCDSFKSLTTYPKNGFRRSFLRNGSASAERKSSSREPDHRFGHFRPFRMTLAILPRPMFPVLRRCAQHMYNWRGRRRHRGIAGIPPMRYSGTNFVILCNTLSGVKIMDFHQPRIDLSVPRE